MSTDVATRPAPAPVPAPAPAGPPPAARPWHAERAAAGLAVRQIWIGALVIVASVGLLLWAGIKAFDKSAKTGGGLMTPLADNPAVRAIYGLPTAIDTKGGFAVWRVELFLMLLVTVWTALATTRVLRGGEETGRFDLVLANPLSLFRATGSSLVALFAVPVAVTALTGAVLQIGGADAGGSWLYAVGLGLLAATFLALASVTSQLVPERRRATGLALGVLFATFVLRMWADGSTNSGWARWLSPYGWVENLHAFGGNDLLPLLPLALTPLVLVATAMVLATRRDTGAGLIRADDTKQASTRWLSRPVAFSARRRAGELAGWIVAVAVLGVLSGGLAQSLVGFPESQPQAMDLLNQVGMGAAVTPGGFVAIMNAFYAVVLAGYAIACVHADYDDETSNRLDLPYSNVVTRTEWGGSTVGTSVVALGILGVALAFATWAGSAMSGAGLSVGDCFASAANVMVIPLLFLGMAVLIHGIHPAWTVSIAGILAIGLYLVDLIGGSLSWPNWIVDLSPYHHLTLVPAQSAAWTAIGVISAIAVASGAVGLVGYAHRDLQ